MKQECFVSVVAPVRDDSAIIEMFIEEAIPILQESFKNYELLLVDDGSQDDTVGRIEAILVRRQGIRLVRLSRRFGTDVAISAGLESVIGDYVVLMLPYMDPPSLIPALVERSIGGVDVVFGVDTDQRSSDWLYGIAMRLFYWYCERFLEIKLPKNSTYLRCLSRKAVNAITQIKDSFRYLRLFSSYVGYPHQEFAYSPVYRDRRRPRRSLLDAINIGVDLIIENSRHPLRMVTWTCIGAAILNIVYIVVIASIYFFKSEVTKGWTSMSLQSAGQFLLLTMMFAILSEYVGRILERLRDRPFYYVMEERISSVPLVDIDRYNIVTNSSATQAPAQVPQAIN